MAYSKTELVESSKEHLQHEIGMLLGTIQLFPEFTNQSDADLRAVVLRNAVVESFAIHLRNIIAFLYERPQKQRQEGLVAEHYVRDVQAWRTARGPQGALLKKARSRADREIAHLTTRRFFGNPPEKRWEALLLLKVLTPPLRTFRAHAQEDRIHPQVLQLIDLHLNRQAGDKES
jgi:hypothetical protein